MREVIQYLALIAALLSIVASFYYGRKGDVPKATLNIGWAILFTLYCRT